MDVARRLGRYRVGARIGSGGVADVFEATVEGDTGVARALVVKLLRREFEADPVVVEAFAEEARLAAGLSHGNLVQVFEFAREDDGSGTPVSFLVLERVDGCSLQALIDDREAAGSRLELAAALFVVDEVAAALEYTHRHTDTAGRPAPVVHRDVKPANVLVSREGVVKLTDFGIAKSTGRRQDTLPGLIKGTPLFIAPEHAAGRPSDARVDVYGLGRVLQWLVIGPPGGNEFITDPRVDAALRDIVRRSIADAPEERTASIAALRAEVRDWCADARVRPAPDDLIAGVRRHRGEAVSARRISLDVASGDAPVEHATRQVPTMPSSAVGTSRRGWLVAGGSVGLLGIVVWWLRGIAVVPREGGRDVLPRSPEMPAPESEATEAAPPRTRPENRPDPAPVVEPSLDAGTDHVAPPPPDERRSRPSTRKLGRLRVNVLPWAEVTLDGRQIGHTPIDVQVSAGAHRLGLFNPDLAQRKSRRIDVTPGGDLSIVDW